jgi:hypothetical protein
VIAKTVRESPPNATRWTRSRMAEAVGIAPASVGRLWAEAGLKPHLTKSFKVSNAPLFEEKVTDIVGLYLDPPERAVVLCVDEKPPIRTLDRTQPFVGLRGPAGATVRLHLEKGRAAMSRWKHASSVMTHDCRRRGTTTLFAALDVKSGKVTGASLPRHRAREFLKLPRRIDRSVPKTREMHLVLDSEEDRKTARGAVFPTNAPTRRPR